jgi:diguanylate cyclase (GGDEF)-like protein
MRYASIGILAIILHLIINRQQLGKIASGTEMTDPERKVAQRYRYFLMAMTSFYVFDIAWGILYEHHDVPGIFPFVYSCTIFYFVSMLLTMLTWIRFLVSFLVKRRLPAKLLLYVVWALFTLGLVFLMINRFVPFIFSFNELHEYVPEHGRYTAFTLQIALYTVSSAYMLYQARKASGQERTSFISVGLTGLVFELFQLLQIFDESFPFFSMGLIIGTCLVQSFVIAGEERKKEEYDQIARSLARHYEAMYYIDIASGEYREFSTSSEYDSMGVEALGKDFYSETQVNARKYAHPDDRDFAESLYHKETMLKNLEEKDSYSYKYRIMIGGETKFFRFTVMKADDGKHLILYEKDVTDEITAETVQLEKHKKHVTFTQIAESLASNYDMIYYIDTQTLEYVCYEFDNLYGQLEMHKSGDDFFTEAANDIGQIVHKNDRDIVSDFLKKDHLTGALREKKYLNLEYRLIVNGRSQYVRMTARKTSDDVHIIIGVENVDAEVRKEKQRLKALNNEKELARRDELTGIKNKNAFMEFEQSLQENMDKGPDSLPFALVVCDTNNLKKINDTLGHAAGDEYIKACAKLLCDIFSHSPVFRIGGDEFAVILRGDDHTNREGLLGKLKSAVRENQSKGEGPVLAAGMSEYDPQNDNFVSEVFDRADHNMYEDKVILKGGRADEIR